MQKVGTHNITELTLAASPNYAQNDPVPSSALLIERLRQEAPDTAKKIEDMLTEIPSGFVAVPVLYTRISQKLNARIESEYLFSVRQRFLVFLATKQQDSLRALGVCEHGITRMARGLHPADVNGQRYDLSVDHIIERCGSGSLSDGHEIDPLRDDNRGATFTVNHFNNLILLPEDVHAFKNTLNGLQNIEAIKEGESRWILMLTPVCKGSQPGYVCAPQPLDSALGHLKVFSPKLQHAVTDSGCVGQHLLEISKLLKENPVLNSLLDALEVVADQQRPLAARRSDPQGRRPLRKIDESFIRKPLTLADLETIVPCVSSRKGAFNALGKNESTPHACLTLSAIFHEFAQRDREGMAMIDGGLRPALRELNAQLGKTYARVQKIETRAHQRQYADTGSRFYQQFVSFFRGRKLSDACLAAARFPLPESRALLKTYRRINSEISQHNRQMKSQVQQQAL